MSGTTSERLRIGVIGAGRLGRIHALNVARQDVGATLVAVSDLSEEAARTLAGEAGEGIAIFTDYLRLIENRDVQAVVVATPTSLKPQIVKAACEIGKHIFCEAPVASSLNEADHVLRSVQKSPVKVQVGYQRRFDPLYQRVKQAVDSGELGDLIYLRSTSREPPGERLPDPKSSGGVFFESASHDYDIIRWLTGSEVSRVMADGVPRSQPEQHTTATNLSMANGALAQVDTTRNSTYGYDGRIEIVGTKGSLFTDLGHPPNPKILKSSSAQSLAATFDAGQLQRFSEAFPGEIRSFVESVRSDQEPRVTARDGRQDAEIAAAAKKCMQEGKVVNLPM